jgi:hypothetical protein
MCQQITMSYFVQKNTETLIFCVLARKGIIRAYMMENVNFVMNNVKRDSLLKKMNF